MNRGASGYDVNEIWTAQTVDDVDDCFRLLLDKRNHVFHGAHQCWRTIKSSLDLRFEEIEESDRPQDKHKVEADLLNRFGEQCFRHLLPGARAHIELARLRWNTYRTTGTMFAARHFALPTRAVDWTPDALVALFFACRRRADKNGVIWCIDFGEFETCVKKQWPLAYGKEGHIEDDFEKDFVDGVDRDVLVKLHFPPRMRRAVAQGAFITVASQFGVDHAQKIHQLGVTGCERVVVPAAVKRQIIEKLDLMGVNGYTLEIGDSTVETIATDIAASLRCCKSVTKVKRR